MGIIDNNGLTPAKQICCGIEDKFSYHITSDCVSCGSCTKVCPVNAISKGENQYIIDSENCIDCGTCSAVCPKGAAVRVPLIRQSIDIKEIDQEHLYFNPGCAMSLYKPELPSIINGILKDRFKSIQLHSICCRHDPQIPQGSTIINNCAGCDRRFRSLYEGINTISLWEVLDSLSDLELPDHTGLTVSVHDSCGYRHKPQVHQAIRRLLAKMNIKVVESKFSGTESVCCGDNFYGYVPNADVEKRIRMRAAQLPSDHVVVYCIGCVRAMEFAGKTPLYLPDLILNKKTEMMQDTLDEYHLKLGQYIDDH